MRPAQRRQRRCWASLVKAACTGDRGREGEEEGEGGERATVTTKCHHQREREKKMFGHLMDLECNGISLKSQSASNISAVQPTITHMLHEHCSV